MGEKFGDPSEIQVQYKPWWLDQIPPKGSIMFCPRCRDWYDYKKHRKCPGCKERED